MTRGRAGASEILADGASIFSDSGPGAGPGLGVLALGFDGRSGTTSPRAAHGRRLRIRHRAAHDSASDTKHTVQVALKRMTSGCDSPVAWASSALDLGAGGGSCGCAGVSATDGATQEARSISPAGSGGTRGGCGVAGGGSSREPEPEESSTAGAGLGSDSPGSATSAKAITWIAERSRTADAPNTWEGRRPGRT